MVDTKIVDTPAKSIRRRHIIRSHTERSRGHAHVTRMGHARDKVVVQIERAYIRRLEDKCHYLRTTPDATWIIYSAFDNIYYQLPPAKPIRSLPNRNKGLTKKNWNNGASWASRAMNIPYHLRNRAVAANDREPGSSGGSRKTRQKRSAPKRPRAFHIFFKQHLGRRRPPSQELLLSSKNTSASKDTGKRFFYPRRARI